jgi:DNA-binding NarL/FixJ family response regulator
MAPLTNQPPIRLMLIDDHPVLRAGLANLLAIERGLEVVAQAGSGEAAIELCRRHAPDVCLLDLSMPGIGGLATLERLQATADCRIIVLTSSESSTDASRALAAGAHGYLTKTVPFPQIVATIHEVHRGGQGICRGVARLPAAGNAASLSPREHSVLLLLRRGLSNPEIGRSLGISERTAKWHVKAILEKLGESDRTAAVAKAFDLGILRVEAPGGNSRSPAGG